MLKNEGFLSPTEVEELPGFPGREALAQKRLAILECAQLIPCDPCENVCPNGAITIGDSIINLPSINVEKCTGCTLCISTCPGLAIFVLDLTQEERDIVFLPFEYYPLPEKGDKVKALNRTGLAVTEGLIRNVVCRGRDDKTAIVELEVPKGFGLEVRGIPLQQGRTEEERLDSSHKMIEQIQEIDDDDTIICRCEEITKREILEAIRDGARDITTLKRMTRAGMGLCQGRNCSSTILSLLAKELKKPIWQLEPPSLRPPVRPVRLDILSKE